MSLVASPFLPNVAVDFNARSAGSVRVRQSKASGPLEVGDAVLVYEPDEGLHGLAVVNRVDEERGLLYLDVDWDTVTDAEVIAQPTGTLRCEAAAFMRTRSVAPPREWHTAATTGMAGDRLHVRWTEVSPRGATMETVTL